MTRDRLATPVASKLKIAVDSLAYLTGLVAISIYSYFVIDQRPDNNREPDTKAYLLMAQSYAKGRLPVWQEDVFRYQSHAYIELKDNTITSKYPPGWPLLMAIAYKLGGYHAALWVNPLLAILGALAFFWLTHELFGSRAAASCTLFWLGCPILLTYAIYPLSHCSDITCVLLAFAFSVRWGKSQKAIHAIAAGFLLSYSVLIRPVDLLLVPAAILLSLFFSKNSCAHPKHAQLFRLFTVFFLTPLILWSIYNTFLFGAPWNTGYSVSGEQMAFDASNILQRVEDIYRQRDFYLENATWMLAIAGLLIGLIFKSRLTLILLLWVLPISLLHLSYYWYAPNFTYIFARFFLTALPGLTLFIGFFFFITRKNQVLHLILLLAAIGWTIYSPPMKAYKLSKDRVNRRVYSTELDPHVQLNTVVYAGRALAMHAAIMEGTIDYSLKAWTDRHYLHPYVENCNTHRASSGPGQRPSKPRPLPDQRRHRRIHEIYAKIGSDGLIQHFVQHMSEQIDAGKHVLYSPTRRHASLTHALISSGLKLNRLGTTHITLYHVTRS